jgi:hypothetical protein
MFHDAFPKGGDRPRHAARPLDFVAWFLLLIFVCCVAFKANAQPACKSEAEIMAIADRVRGAVQKLEPVAARAAILFYDSIPPESTSDADSAALVHLPDGSGVILIAKGSCYFANAPVPPNYWRSVVDAIMGARS